MLSVLLFVDADAGPVPIPKLLGAGATYDARRVVSRDVVSSRRTGCTDRVVAASLGVRALLNCCLRAPTLSQVSLSLGLGRDGPAGAASVLHIVFSASVLHPVFSIPPP